MDPHKLLMVLANSDVELDTHGYCGIQFVYGAGCLFIGPEEGHTLEWTINTRHPLSNYPVKTIKAEGEPFDGTWVTVMGLETNESFLLHRTAESLPNYAGYQTMPWEVYQSMRTKEPSL